MRKQMKKTVKYGSLSLAFVAVVLVAIVLLNLIISLVEQKTSLNIDLTDTGVYSVSAAAKAFIEDIDTPITIYFCKERDKLDADGDAVLMVRNLIEEFGKEFDNITVKYIDIIKDKEQADKWQKESTTSIQTYSIIVEGANGQFRHLYPAGFFVTAESTGDLYGFKGEVTLTNAIIQVSGEEQPVVAFTTGHTEDISVNQLMVTLVESGFSVQVVDLTKDEEIPENTKILFINNPKYDFQGYSAEQDGGVNEIDKLAAFMNDFNHIIVTVNPDTPELPELSEFLSEWGLGWQTNTQIIDTKGAATGADSAATRLIAQYVTDDTNTAAYQVIKSLVTMASTPRTIFNNSVPLIVTEPTNGSTVATSFTSAATAIAYKDDEEVDSDAMPLMAVASKQKYIGEAGAQALIYSTVVLIGSTDLGADNYVTGQYGNKEVFYSLARIMGSERVPNGLEFKRFYDQGLTIDQSTAETLTIVLCAVGPLFVAIIGFIVFLKRRHL
ncbi:MAG: hypothetical protein A2Y17_05950 [Clostridiales bacterium GWF2_38_85]|nr:MAG: hypothetical protein A2Y17_05950 [Clostridiales bacterium GWF2_38_85]